MNSDVILAGGPAHGRVLSLSDDSRFVNIADSAPLARSLLTIEPAPRPPWWQPLRRRKWKPAAPADIMPEVKVSVYRRSLGYLDGHRIFWHVGDRAPAPTPDDPMQVLSYMYSALGRQDPAFRHKGRWLMGPEWFAAIRAATQQEQRLPMPGVLILSLPADIVPGAGPAVLVSTS